MGKRALGVAALLVLVSSPSAWAGAPTERLRTFFDEANRVLTAPETQTDPLEALARVKRLVNDVFDFRGAAEQALGPAWQARSRAERDEFTALFADLLQKNFVGRVATKARMDGGLSVRYLDEQIQDDTATVRTSVEARDGHELRLEYRMVRRWPRGWKVRDVAMDGVGLLANYQAQFARVLHSGSYQELVAQMRAKAQPSPELLALLAESEELPPSAAPAAVVAAAPAPPPVAPA
ncbi:MAG: MlaC/ttg2D family ABC transporter substrate-binding protein, partial [Candidatus Rokuibacteriota bacterium]